VTEEKGLEKKRGIEGEGSGLKEAGGLGGRSPPQKQDVTEEKGLEKKRVIESEGSGLKEAGGLGGRSPQEENGLGLNICRWVDSYLAT
jgi:hypothetical protein